MWSPSVLSRETVGCLVLGSRPTAVSLFCCTRSVCFKVFLASLMRTSHRGRAVLTVMILWTSVSAHKFDNCYHSHFMEGETGSGRCCENTPRLHACVRPRPAASFYDTEACPIEKKNLFSSLSLLLHQVPVPSSQATSFKRMSLISSLTRPYAARGTCVAGFLVAGMILKIPSVLSFQLRQGIKQLVELRCWWPGTAGSNQATEVGMCAHTKSFWASPRVLWTWVLGICDTSDECLERPGQARGARQNCPPTATGQSHPWLSYLLARP